MTNLADHEPRLAGASQDAIQHHYDVGNDFYALWLDETLSYSGALYLDERDSLEVAQRAKLDYWVDQLQLPEGGRLLDVGCGWGGMIGRATSRVPGVTARGLTLSAAQAEHVRGLGIDVALESWEDHEPAEPYDAIVSLGAFEHFATGGMTRDERVIRYRSFFERCYAWLPPGGRLGLQTIALDGPERTHRGLGRYFVEDVFPESSLPRLGEVVQASEELFRHVALRIDPAHYARTCREWRRRLHANREQAEVVAGRDQTTHYRKMLFLAEREFLTGSATLYRFTLERRDAPVPAGRGVCSDDPDES